MVLAIAALFLQIQAFPQNSILTLSTANEMTEPASVPDTTNNAFSLDTIEPENPAFASELPAPQGLSQTLDQPSRSAIAARLSRSLVQKYPEKLRRREWLALSIAQHGAATFDAWSTRHVISSGQGQERNPFLRPFAGNASLYAAIQVAPVLFDYLGRRMATSPHGWAVRTWWIPQAVSSAITLAGSAHNLRSH